MKFGPILMIMLVAALLLLVIAVNVSLSPKHTASANTHISWLDR